MINSKKYKSLLIFIILSLTFSLGILIRPMIKTVQANPGWAVQYTLPSSTFLRGIWGSSSTDVFAVGQTGTSPNFTGTIFHYDGATWTQMAIGTTGRLFGIWGSSSTDVFAVGDSGTILHYYNGVEGFKWYSMNSGTPNWLESVWGSSSNDIFVAGVETILHYDGNSWSKHTVNDINLQGIWGSSGNDVFAVGMSGTILHYDGISWSTMTSNYTGWIRGIWGSSSTDVFAVGDSGTILHYNGTAWSKMTSGITNNLRGIWGSSSTDVFAVGDSSILHYNGIGWSSMSFPLDTLYGIWGNSSANIFTVGASRILHYQPTDTFTVTYNANGGSNPPTDSNSPYNDGATVTVLGAGGMTWSGYTFSKWNSKADGSGTDYLPGATFTIRNNITLYAKWTVKQYTVTFEANGGTPVPAQQTLDYGSKVTKPDDPSKTGYTFGGWYKDAEFTDDWDFDNDTVPAENITLYAKWTVKQYTVTFDSQGGSTVPSQTINYGGKVTKPTDPTKAGYTFGGWYKEVACTNQWDFDNDTVTDNITLYAQWSQDIYTVTFDTLPPNTGTITFDSVSYSDGDSASKPPNTYNISGNPATGYTFTRWETEGGVSVTDPNSANTTCTVSVNGTLRMVQTINTYIIKATAGPNGSINPSGDVIVTYGDDQTFNFYPNTGYRIADVLVDGISVGKPNSYTFFNVTTNHTIHVEFEVDSTCFFDTKSGARIYIDLNTPLAPRWRVTIPSKRYDTGWMPFRRYTKTNNHFWGEYADTRYHFIIDFYSSGRYHIIFDDRVTRISIKIAN